MKKHGRTNTLNLLATLPLILAGQTINAQEQRLDKVPADTVVNVGYATGSIKKLSGSVELIKEDQMNKIQIVNPIEAIQGRVAGLTVGKGGNGTAALDAVRLRGTTSITGGNSPLIIVDGVIGDMTLLTSIYPTDIESFTILKDASETAQYGSHGASGVINVVTKKGVRGRTSINYSGSFGISSVYKRIGMLDADAYRNVTSGLGLGIIDKGCNTDFQKAIERTAIRQNHNIALYGGGEKSSYRVSLGYLDMEGDIMNEGMKMFTSNHESEPEADRRGNRLRTRYIRFGEKGEEPVRPAEDVLFSGYFQPYFSGGEERFGGVGQSYYGESDNKPVGMDGGGQP